MLPLQTINQFFNSITMKKFLFIVVFIIATTSLSFGQVDESYSKTLKTMFEVSGTEDSYKGAITQMFNMFKQQYPEVDAAIWTDYKAEFMKTSLDDLVKMMTPVYNTYLTEKDLQEIIKFYKSPIGKKLGKSTPMITQESMKLGQQWGMKISEEFKKKMTEKGY